MAVEMVAAATEEAVPAVAMAAHPAAWTARLAAAARSEGARAMRATTEVEVARAASAEMRVALAGSVAKVERTAGGVAGPPAELVGGRRVGRRGSRS